VHGSRCLPAAPHQQLALLGHLAHVSLEEHHVVADLVHLYILLGALQLNLRGQKQFNKCVNIDSRIKNQIRQLYSGDVTAESMSRHITFPVDKELTFPSNQDVSDALIFLIPDLDASFASFKDSSLDWRNTINTGAVFSSW
jgi:hypothetical protein